MKINDGFKSGERFISRKKILMEKVTTHELKKSIKSVKVKLKSIHRSLLLLRDVDLDGDVVDAPEPPLLDEGEDGGCQLIRHPTKH